MISVLPSILASFHLFNLTRVPSHKQNPIMPLNGPDKRLHFENELHTSSPSPLLCSVVKIDKGVERLARSTVKSMNIVDVNGENIVNGLSARRGEVKSRNPFSSSSTRIKEDLPSVCARLKTMNSQAVQTVIFTY